MNVWNQIAHIQQQLEKYPTKILMLDYDGTLTPIVRSPERAKLSVAMKQVLSQLHTKKDLSLAVVSGRSLENIKQHIKIPGIIYAGNHGLEYELSGKSGSLPVSPTTQTALKEIAKKLQKIVALYPGTQLENKGMGLSFHYRNADRASLPHLTASFEEALHPFVEKKLVSVIKGKMVFDIRPFDTWNKGDFAEFLIKKLSSHTKNAPLPVYIGDDTTDEDVFRILKKGITIRVGSLKKSYAAYSLSNTKDVLKFLEWLKSVV